MRTIAVDDEPWMLKRFSIECESIPGVQLLGCFKSPVQALEFAKSNSIELAFLDVEMPVMNGLELAGKLRELYPELIVIFVSAYESYMAEAFKSKSADYYIMKPYDTGDIEAAIDRARLLSGRLRKKIRIHTFGEFEVFLENKPITFPDRETKELFALLIDKHGGVLTAEEAVAALFPTGAESENGIVHYNRILRRLQEALKSARLDGVVDQNKDGAFVHTDIVDCDLFQYLEGDLKTIRQFSGDYLTAYSWAADSRRKLCKQQALLEQYNDTQTRNTLCASIRCLSDAAATLTYMNAGFLAMTGYTREEIMERYRGSLRALILREDYERITARGTDWSHQDAPVDAEYRLVNKAGDEIWVLAKCEPQKRPENGLNEWTCILIDISGLKSEQYSLEQAASRDGLTGLLNRVSAEERTRRYLSDTDISPAGALILMDIDNFKAVNDTYGHPFADTVLTDIAAILTRSFRSSDILSRLGGDEMMIFLKGVQKREEAQTKLQAAMKTLNQRLKAKTERGELSCSFGAVMCPEDGSDFDMLYQRADLALYAAKEQKDCAVWFADIRMKVVDKLIAREVTEIESSGNASPAQNALCEPLPDLSCDDALPERILDALTQIGRLYDISRAYVFEMARDQPVCVNTFEWCAAHAQPEIEHLQALPAEVLGPYYEELFTNDGLLYAYDIRLLSPPLYEILEPQGIKSMLQCELTHDGTVFGMVGFDECRQCRYWNGRQIKALADFSRTLEQALFHCRQAKGGDLSDLQSGAKGYWEQEGDA